jgi:hypothetical protein
LKALDIKFDWLIVLSWSNQYSAIWGNANKFPNIKSDQTSLKYFSTVFQLYHDGHRFNFLDVNPFTYWAASSLKCRKTQTTPNYMNNALNVQQRHIVVNRFDTSIASKMNIAKSLIFCNFSFGHCVVCSSIYGFWLPLLVSSNSFWYVKNFNSIWRKW